MLSNTDQGHAGPRIWAQGAPSRPVGAVAGRHVVIVGINYWPEPTGIAPYTTALAEYLARDCASVRMIAGLPCYPAWTVPAQYRRGLRFRETRNGVHIQRLKHAVPRRQDVLRRGAYEVSFLGAAATVRLSPRPDLILAVTPALGGAVAAAHLAKRHDAPLAVVVQDLLGSAVIQTGISGGAKAAGAVSRLESWALRQADAVAVVTDAFRPAIEAYGVPTQRIATVPNWSHVVASTADRELTRASLGWPEDLTVVLHTGNMGLKQGLGNVIEAARLTAGRRDLRWVLLGEGSQRESLQEQARGLPNLDFLPLCDEERYRDILSAADILLLNERAGVQEMCLPSKLTSYFMSGRPVAAAVATGGAAAAELARAGAPDPVAPEDPAALVDLVDRLRTSSQTRDRHGEAAATYAKANLTIDAAMKRLDTLLQSCVSPRRRVPKALA